MYAARAKELPQPCKWFTAGPYFRAERPQRGRLREFLQWNVDAIGLPGEDATPETKFRMDSEVIECSLRLFESLGLTDESVALHMNDRSIVDRVIQSAASSDADLDAIYAALDKRKKMNPDAFSTLVQDAGLNLIQFDTQIKVKEGEMNLAFQGAVMGSGSSEEAVREAIASNPTQPNAQLARLLRRMGFASWSRYDSSIVRGLAYYTGTVFEAIAEGERAVAGGGRYDNLIELFGGPPTPACGFGMGDVVLGNLLDDKGLMPTGSELMDAVARPQASIRPVAFVVPNGDEENEPLVHTLVANLRRGIECNEWSARDDRKPWDANRYRVAPMHARVSYKSTRNLKKLRADAVNQHARYFVEIHADNKVELTDLDKREPITSDTHGSFSVDPSAENYVGTAITARV
jgi:histidyl-tRNA synthetase